MDRDTETGTVRLSIHLEKAQEKDIIEVPFGVGSNVESLHVNMHWTSTDQQDCTIDLGVKGPHGPRGWSGGARTRFSIHDEFATPGYVPGPIDEGAWAILLGLYQLPGPGVDVTIDVDRRPSQARWVKGDLHAHTVHSDGSFTLSQAIESALSAGLDFMTLTDHNTVSQNLSHPTDSNLLLMPGMEFTTYAGHANLIGIPRPVDDFLATQATQVDERLLQASQRGAFVSINHPFETTCESCPWRWAWSSDRIDGVEIWNGPWRDTNETALHWWQDQLVQGYRWVAVGGSDTHSAGDPYVRHGRPTTWVYTTQLRTSDVLSALRAGHVFMSYQPTGPQIRISCDEWQMGDIVPANSKNHKVLIDLDQLSRGDEIRVISDAGLVSHQVIDNPFPQLALSLFREHERFLRVEIWRAYGSSPTRLLAAMSNPLYFSST